MGAGLGFKTFVTGDVLTAADTNGYLMQGVWVFANAAARDAAVTSPQEGNMCYLKDTDAVQYYSGSAWTAVGGSGGGMTVIASGAHSGTTIDISSIAATYNELYFTWSDYQPTTDGDYLRMRFNNVSTANYAGVFGNEELGVAVSVSAFQMSQTQDNGTADGQGAVTILDYKNTTSWKFTQAVALTNDPTTSTSARLARIAGYWNNTSAINRIQVVTVSGNSFNLNYVLYGVK
jgi:hypothetical protein